MSGFGRTLLSGSPFLFFAIVPFLVLGALAVTLPLGYSDGFHLAAVVACDVTALLLAVSLWPWHPMGTARRLLTGWIALLFTLYAFDAWLPGLLPAKGSPSEPWSALAGFVVVGLPCWKHALLGRFSLAPEPIEMPVDEPLLLAAYARARAELGRLAAAFAEGDPDTVVLLRFPFTTAAGEVEHLWGQVLALEPAGARVVVLTQPVTQVDPLGEVGVALDDIEDFEFEDAEGQLVGGFTTRAMVAYADREGLPVPRSVRRRLERYVQAA